MTFTTFNYYFEKHFVIEVRIVKRKFSNLQRGRNLK